MESEPSTGAPGWRPFTVPNLFSFGRLLCVPWFLYLLFAQDNRYGAAVLLAVLGATDWVDGWIARRFDQVSELGKILDPTADRLMLLAAVIGMWVDGSVPAWFALLTLIREGLVSAAALALGALGVQRFDVTWWGKTGTFLLMFAYPLLLAAAGAESGAAIYETLGWICGIPGLVIAWYAALGYIPIARDALADARSTSG